MGRQGAREGFWSTPQTIHNGLDEFQGVDALPHESLSTVNSALSYMLKAPVSRYIIIIIIV